MQNTENNENEEKQTLWSIELGFYPGILMGFRTYQSEDTNTHVIYFPFFLSVAIYVSK